MIHKYFLYAILSMASFQEVTVAKSEGPLIPRLKYNSNGRQLDYPESITYFLAEYNSQGFPVELIYRSVENELSLSDQPSIDEIAEALRSPEIQQTVEEAALDHFADVLNEPEAHNVLESAGKEQWTVCTYSWLSWLPWLDCPNDSRSTTVAVPQREQYAQCFEPKLIHF